MVNSMLVHRSARDIFEDRQARKDYKLKDMDWLRTCEDSKGNVYGIQRLAEYYRGVERKSETLLGTMNPKEDSKPLLNLNTKKKNDEKVSTTNKRHRVD